MKKLGYAICVCMALSLMAAVCLSADNRVIVHYGGNEVADVSAEKIDSTVLNKMQLVMLDSNKKTLMSRLLTRIDSITFRPQTYEKDFTTAYWEISASRAQAAETSWITNNKFYATDGSKASVAYVSTMQGGATVPQRALNGNNVSVSNLNTNDAIVFSVPVKKLEKGSSVDFMLTIYTPSANAPKYWIFEYEDGDEWKSIDGSLKTAAEDPALKYSFYVKYFSSAQYTTFVQSFVAPRNYDDEELRMRCRVVGAYNNAGGALTPDATAYVGFVNTNWQGCHINTYQELPVQDTIKLAILGNSFTYYYGTPFMLKEIARSQGHEIVMRANIKGSQYFRNHSALELSQAVVKEGGYDYVLLQDQSGQHAKYASDSVANADVLAETKALLSQIKAYSPGIQPIIENTWAFLGSSNYEGYGSFDKFDKALQDGSVLVCARANTWESPVGIAFQKAREAGITDLYHTDNKHPNRNGAYLKACVNYLMLYGTPFDSNVPSLLVDGATAKKLREIAESVVLGHENTWRNPDPSTIVPDPVTPTPVNIDSIVAGESGIRTAAQFVSFATLWNANGDVSSYKDANGEVALLGDIDLSGVDWTPIGNVPSGSSWTNGTSVTYGSGHAFDAVFNGNGHTISGLKLSTTEAQIYGLFGLVKGGTVKNVNLDATCQLSVNRTNVANGCSYGLLVGNAYNAQITNCTVAGRVADCVLNGSGLTCLGGIVGYFFSGNTSSSITDCTFEGTVSGVSSNVFNNSTCAACAGIVGFARASSASTYFLLKNCVNRGSITASFHRTAGVLGSTPGGMHMEGCKNYGTINNTTPSNTLGNRAGGLMGISSCTSASYADYMDGCENYGTVISGAAVNGKEVIGGLAGIVRRMTVKNCISSCLVVAPATVQDRGVFVGEVNDNNAKFSANKVSGSMATGIDKDGDYENLIVLTESNYTQYMGQYGSSYSGSVFNASGITFGN